MGTNDWEEDILGVVCSLERVTIAIYDGSGACRFDFRTVFADGDEAVKGNVNVVRPHVREPAEVARPRVCESKRGLLGLAEPSLIA